MKRRITFGVVPAAAVTLILIGMLISFAIFTNGCATTGGTGSETTDIIIEETIDAFGYTLGLMAAKDPELKADIKKYYTLVETGEFTLAALNILLKEYSQENVAYQVLIYKMNSLVKRLGGEVLPDGTITSLGRITKEHLEIGKNSYLLALNNAEVING